MQRAADPGPPDGTDQELMPDLEPGAAHGHAAAKGPLATIAYTLGGIGLLGATAADSLAVAGRHTGVHLLGSIELVMLLATLPDTPASGHLVTDRLSRPAAARLARVAAALSALTFLALAAGSIWLASDLWRGFEQTELLHIPLRWLRVLWIAFALVIAGRFALKAPGPSRTAEGA